MHWDIQQLKTSGEAEKIGWNPVDLRTCQDKEMVTGLPLLHHVLSLQVGALVHALHHVFDLLQLQPLQVLVLVQGIRQQLLHTVQRQKEGDGKET